MKYNNNLIAILIIVILLIIDVSVSGNSAQLENYQPPGFDLIPVDNTDIYVKHEDLLFDFSISDDSNNLDQGGRVTATYDMGNPGETKTIKMGFPFYLDNIFHTGFLTDVSVTANNQAIEPKLYFKDDQISSGMEDYSFEDALVDLVPEDYRFDEEMKLKMFSINSSKLEFDVSMRCDYKARVYYDNLVLFPTENEDNNIKYNFKKNHFIEAENFLIYSSDLNSEMIAPGIDYTEEIVTYNDLLDRIVGSESNNDKNLELRNYALLKLVLKEQIEESNASILSFFDLLTTRVYNVLVILVYDVELIGNDVSNIISISYNTQPSYNMHYEPTIYKTIYISNPAKNWESFNSLDIKIIPHKHNKYVIDANLDFIRGDDGSYTFSLDGLPDKNIVFYLSSSEEPVTKPIEKAPFTHLPLSNNIFLYIIFYLPIVLFLLIIVSGIVLLIIGFKKKKTRSS